MGMAMGAHTRRMQNPWNNGQNKNKSKKKRKKKKKKTNTKMNHNNKKFIKKIYFLKFVYLFLLQ